MPAKKIDTVMTTADIELALEISSRGIRRFRFGAGELGACMRMNGDWVMIVRINKEGHIWTRPLTTQQIENIVATVGRMADLKRGKKPPVAPGRGAKKKYPGWIYDRNLKDYVEDPDFTGM